MADEVLLVHEGFEELLQALEHAPEAATPLLRQAMLRALLAIEGRVAEYSPESEANRPRSWSGSAYHVFSRKRASLNTWYERGYGPKWVRKDGTVNGRKTSRFLGRQWSREVRVSPGLLIEGVVGNSAPYAPHVHGEEQASFHARRGWLTLDQGLEQSQGDIDAALEEAATGLIQALARR